MNDLWDPDIATMDLTDEEKNGLQVFRNYFDAFERHRAQSFVESLDSEAFSVRELATVLDHIVSEEPRALPVIVCAFADEMLLSMLKREIPEGVPGGRSALFNGFGPLSRLSGRIQICFAFGWLDPELLRELDALRKIRNDISHQWNLEALKDRMASFTSSGTHPVEGAFDISGKAPEGFYEHLRQEDRLRLRLIWIVGRTFYESLVWVRAVKAGVTPHSTLYLDHQPKLLVSVADACMKASRRLVGSS